VADTNDTAIFSQLFVDALVYLLALDLVAAINSDNARIDVLMTNYGRALTAARHHASKQVPIYVAPLSDGLIMQARGRNTAGRFALFGKI